MRNLRLDLCYDGTRYRGWQRQPNKPNSIQEKLEATLSRILEEPVEVYGSGRTDAGVHAKGQVANFHCSSELPAEEILRQLREYLPEDIGVYSCRDVSFGFHARYRAVSKTYCYRIWRSEEPCVFERRYVGIWREPLDLSRMKQAADYMKGTHDFGAFCTNPGKKHSTMRSLSKIRMQETDRELRIYFTGNGFLHHMVRFLVGTLLEIGSGSMQPEDVVPLLESGKGKPGFLADAAGLCLMEVNY